MKTLYPFFLAATAIGCNNIEAPHLGPRGSGDDSLVASIGGMNDKDTANSDLSYQLVCKGYPQPVIGKLGADQKSVQFPGAAIKDGDNCALEVRMADLAKAAALPYQWYGKRADLTVDKGLFYGSDQKPVVNRALSLKLFLLYKDNTPPTVDTFDMVARVQIDPAANAPTLVGSKYLAQLTCGTKQISVDASGIKAAAAAQSYDITFAKNVLADFKALSCTHIAIVQNVSAYSADYAGTVELWGSDFGPVALAGAAANKTVDLPDATNRVTLRAPVVVPPTSTATSTGTSAGTGTVVSVGTTPGGNCLNYVADACLDRTSQQLSFNQNYAVARVQGLKADGTTAYLVVAAGPGVGLYTKGVLTTDDLTGAIKAKTVETTASAYAWYKDTADAQSATVTALQALPFDNDLVSGKSISSDLRVADADLAGVRILHIAQVWVHGFHPVEKPALDSAATASWLALVTSAKSGDAQHQFIVTSKAKYFLPAGPLATAGGKQVYFDQTSLAADMALTDGGSRYQVYALATDAAVPACQAQLTLYTQDQSAKTLTMLTSADSGLDACAYAPAAFNTALLGADRTVSATYFVWEWTSLIK